MSQAATLARPGASGCGLRVNQAAQPCPQHVPNVRMQQGFQGAEEGVGRLSGNLGLLAFITQM